MEEKTENLQDNTPNYHEYVRKIDALILNYIDGGGQQTTTIGDVSFQYCSLKDLERLRAKYASLAQAQDIAQGKLKCPSVINSRLYV